MIVVKCYCCLLTSMPWPNFTSKNAEFILGLLLLLLLLLIYRHFDFTLKSGTFGPNPGRVATLTATNTLFDPDLPGGSSGLGAGPPGEV